MCRYGRTLAGAMSLVLLVTATSQAVTYSDANVSTSGQWAQVVSTNAPAAGLYVINTGNGFIPSYPAGIYRVTGFPHSNTAGVAWGVGSRYTGGTYTPSVDGAIGSVDFEVDTRKGSLDGVRIAFLMMQGGKYYRSNFFTQLPGGSTPLEVFSQTGLDATDFGEFVGLAYDYGTPGDGSANFLSNPDFSAGGSTIQLGYLSHFDASLSALHPDGIAYQFTTSWSVTINPVPEPASLSALALGALLLRRRR